jgi:hypothetical protein
VGGVHVLLERRQLPDSGVQRPDLRVQEVGDVALVLDNLR